MSGDRCLGGAFVAEVRNQLRSSDVRVDAPLGAMTTYRVGGSAAVLVSIGDESDLAVLAELVSAHPAPVAVIGRGSNLLVADAGFEGVAVHLGESLARVELAPDVVRVGGAASLPTVARQLTAAGRSGFEWAVGVPGTVGGAVRMNAGGHGSDMAASVLDATVVDLRTGTREVVRAEALRFGYRTSAIAPHQVVVAASLQLGEGDPLEGQRTLAEVVRWRREHQPGGQNAGSVFTNPPGDSAGRLIDTAGLKGFRIGSAEVSPKHANFIQADPAGRASDIVALMIEIVRRVHEVHGVVLHAETRLVGFGPEETALMYDPRED